MNIRGSVSAREVIKVIIALVAFILVGMLLFELFNTDDLTEREICRVSILERATLPGVFDRAIPLACTTEKICITPSKKYTCAQFAGESNVRSVVVNIRPGMALEEQRTAVRTIEQETVNSLLDCWVMTGQGKLDLFSKHDRRDGIATRLVNEAFDKTDISISEIRPKCIVCSRLAFSEELYNANEEYKKSLDPSDISKKGVLESVDINEFMAKELVGNTGKTYLSFFSGDDGARAYAELSALEAQSGLKNVRGSNQVATVLMQIKVADKTKNEQFWDTFETSFYATSSGALAGAFLGRRAILSNAIPGPGWIKAVGTLVAIGGVSTGVAYGAGSAAEETQGRNLAAAAGACSTFESQLPDKQRGCTLAKLMKWDAQAINEVCFNIEGNL